MTTSDPKTKEIECEILPIVSSGSNNDQRSLTTIKTNDNHDYQSQNNPQNKNHQQSIQTIST